MFKKSNLRPICSVLCCPFCNSKKIKAKKIQCFDNKNEKRGMKINIEHAVGFDNQNQIQITEDAGHENPSLEGLGIKITFQCNDCEEGLFDLEIAGAKKKTYFYIP